jgi:hypothetical protein
MSRSAALLSSLLLLAGCSGAVTDPDGGTPGRDAGVDAGPPPLRYTQFTRRVDGWPSGAAVRGAAALDGVLYAATDQGLFALPSTETRWAPVTTPLSGDVKPTSLQRVDQSLVMTAAGATGGGLYVRPYDGDWSQLSAAPARPTWALVRKGSEWLMPTTGGLMRAATLDGPWTRRSAMSTPAFASPVRLFVAAPAQQKLFAAGDAGGLVESADLGATWTAGTPRGTVAALAATGAFVLVVTSMDGQQRSDNYGNTFRAAAAPLPGIVLTYAVNGAQFWAGTSDGLFTSADDGASFTSVSGLPAGTSVRAVFFAQGYAVADTSDGVYVNQVQ